MAEEEREEPAEAASGAVPPETPAERARNEALPPGPGTLAQQDATLRSAIIAPKGSKLAKRPKRTKLEAALHRELIREIVPTAVHHMDLMTQGYAERQMVDPATNRPVLDDKGRPVVVRFSIPVADQRAMIDSVLKYAVGPVAPAPNPEGDATPPSPGGNAYHFHNLSPQQMRDLEVLLAVAAGKDPAELPPMVLGDGAEVRTLPEQGSWPLATPRPRMVRTPNPHPEDADEEEPAE